MDGQRGPNRRHGGARVAAQFTAGVTLPDAANRVVILVLSGIYVLLAVAQLVRRGKIGVRTARDGVVTPLPGLAER